jgi:hypothetical protein
VRGGYDLNEPWPESLYQEALIIMNAEAGYRLSAEEVEEEAEKRRKAMPQTGFVAGRGLEYWQRFITDGQLDQERAVKEGGLTEEQLPEKIAEMEALGWLGDAPDPADTQPLEEPAEPIEE